MSGWASKEQQRAYQREWYARRRADWFAGKRCLVCGTSKDLRLDHIDPTKKVSHRVWSWSAKRRAAELDKCQVLCEDHHREKTAAGGEQSSAGERNPGAKLTEADVLAMRRLRAEGVTYTELGRRYGLTRCGARSAVVRNWQHVPG